MKLKPWLFSLVLCAAAAVAPVSGDSGAGTGSNVMRAPASVRLVPFRDPWKNARPRRHDIDDVPLGDLLPADFSYAASQVTLTYDCAPRRDCFVGHISARGLKPYFAYQLKLVGKPADGVRGWGKAGDDWSNERLGYAGRWWNDADQYSSDDEIYDRYYRHTARKNRHTIYGYLYMGVMVTDAQGAAELDVAGDHSYHITWQDKQPAAYHDVVAGTFPALRGPVKLWYEWQEGRRHDVHLKRGKYNCRLLLTEESFHNQTDFKYDPTDDVVGGLWMTVLASEDFDAAGKADADPANDIAFTIGR